MPVIQKVMKGLKQQYGDKKGEQIYYAMENKQKNMKKKMKLAGLKTK
jgi:hypothetical protein